MTQVAQFIASSQCIIFLIIRWRRERETHLRAESARRAINHDGPDADPRAGQTDLGQLDQQSGRVPKDFQGN